MCNIVYNTNEQLIKDVQNTIDVLFLVIPLYQSSNLKYTHVHVINISDSYIYISHMYASNTRS